MKENRRRAPGDFAEESDGARWRLWWPEKGTVVREYYKGDLLTEGNTNL